MKVYRSHKTWSFERTDDDALRLHSTYWKIPLQLHAAYISQHYALLSGEGYHVI
jgi:hypothetical protein